MSHRFQGPFKPPGGAGCLHHPAQINMWTLFFFAFLLLLLTPGLSNARELTLKKNARGYQVEATLSRYPLVLGDNSVEIEIKDGSGTKITDAEVLVNYYMPPMPRMVPMNYKTKARPEGQKYHAEMDIIMAGPWYIRVIIKHRGKISTTKFNVDAQ